MRTRKTVAIAAAAIALLTIGTITLSTASTTHLERRTPVAAIDLGPSHDLAKRLFKMERDIANLSTRDILQNAALGDARIVAINAAGDYNVKSGMVIPYSYTTITPQVVATIPVPTGFSRAVVTIIATAGGLNSTSTTSGLFVDAYINGAFHDFGGVNGSIAPGTFGTVSDSWTLIQDDLSSGSIQVGAWMGTEGATVDWAASPRNFACVNATVIFLQ